MPGFSEKTNADHKVGAIKADVVQYHTGVVGTSVHLHEGRELRKGLDGKSV